MKKDNIEKVLKNKMDTSLNVEITSFEERKQSFLYELEVGGRKYFLKIRKHSFQRKKDFEKAIHDKLMRESTQNEWEALNYYYNITEKEDCPVNFIKPTAYIEELNGIVTEKVEGKDLWRVLKSGRKKEYVKKSIRKAGEGLSYLHKEIKGGSESAEFNVNSTGNEYLDGKVGRVFEKYTGHPAPVVLGAPVSDIRDIFVSHDNEVYFLDLERLEEMVVYRTVARIIASLKLIRQGDLLFPFKKIDESYEEEFLRGYFGDGGYDEGLLNAFMLEALTMFYNHALKKIDYMNISRIPVISAMVKKFYIDRFYYREIEKVFNGIH